MKRKLIEKAKAEFEQSEVPKLMLLQVLEAGKPMIQEVVGLPRTKRHKEIVDNIYSKIKRDYLHPFVLVDLGQTFYVVIDKSFPFPVDMESYIDLALGWKNDYTRYVGINFIVEVDVLLPYVTEKLRTIYEVLNEL